MSFSGNFMPKRFGAGASKCECKLPDKLHVVGCPRADRDRPAPVVSGTRLVGLRFERG